MGADPLEDWDFDLPDDRIARYPADRRDESRLMVIPRTGAGVQHTHFHALPDLLRAGDLLVVNDSRVMAARLRARRATGGAVELLLLAPGPGPVPCLIRPARRLKVGEVLTLDGGGEVTLLARPDDEGIATVSLSEDPAEVMARQGELPLPPYLGRAAEPSDAERYQTVYAQDVGSAAAPTAGLHFTQALLDTLAASGVGLARVTLHVGLSTFRPLRPEDLARGRLHTEPISVPEATAEAVARTKAAGGRVIAVGTTAARTLEARARAGGVAAGTGSTDLFLRPGSELAVVDGLITNFHLPRSSLLMLVATLIGRERLLAAYREAVAEGYRFYSYGDATLVI